MTFDNPALAMIASFVNRFAIGFIIFNLKLSINSIMKGIFVGLFLSLPDALVTKEYVPILGLGLLGGAICGIFSK